MDLLKKIYPLLLTTLLSGCYEDFDPKIDTKPVLCLNSLITAGQPIEIKVSRTWAYTDEDGTKDHSVSDATVKIYANGDPVDADYVPAEGDMIRVHASSPTYGEAEAEVAVPIAVQVSDADFSATVTELRTYYVPGWSLSADLKFDIRISMNLEDPGNTEDYHRLTYKTFSPGGSYGSPTASHAVLSGGNFDAMDPVFYEQVDTFDDIMYGSYSCNFFSDRLYNGEVKPLTFGFSNCFLDLSNWDLDVEGVDCGWDITLYTISASYYNWLACTSQSEGIIFGDLGGLGFADPIWGYSNVSTGAGVVAAQSSATIRINIKDFISKTFKR